MNTFKKLTSIVLFFVAVASVSAFKSENTANLSLITIRNNSDYDIDHIFFSLPGKAKWGDSDVLGKSEVLAPGDEIDIEVPCGTWDVKIVMEDGGECYSYGEAICGNDEVWEIDNLDCTDEE